MVYAGSPFLVQVKSRIFGELTTTVGLEYDELDFGKALLFLRGYFRNPLSVGFRGQ
jgi:hypothetical protein